MEFGFRQFGRRGGDARKSELGCRPLRAVGSRYEPEAIEMGTIEIGTGTLCYGRC
jgi:hypothetical protein